MAGAEAWKGSGNEGRQEEWSALQKGERVSVLGRVGARERVWVLKETECANRECAQERERESV